MNPFRNPNSGNAFLMMAGATGTPGMGGHTVGEAAEAAKYRPIWLQERSEGKTDLQFREWLQDFYKRSQG